MTFNENKLLYLESNLNQSNAHRKCTAAVAGQSFHGQNSQEGSALPQYLVPSSLRPSIPCHTCKRRTCSDRVLSISGPNSPHAHSVRPYIRENSGNFRQHNHHGRYSWQSRIHHRASCTLCPSSQSCRRIHRSNTALDPSTAQDKSLKREIGHVSLP